VLFTILKYVFPLDQFEMLVNGYVISTSFVFGWIKLTPFLLIAINNCSGNVGSDVC